MFGNPNEGIVPIWQVNENYGKGSQWQNDPWNNQQVASLEDPPLIPWNAIEFCPHIFPLWQTTVNSYIQYGSLPRPSPPAERLSPRFGCKIATAISMLYKKGIDIKI